MPLVTLKIKGKELKVHVPEGSHSVEHAIKYLKKNEDNAEDAFQAARHDRINGKTHFETNKPGGYTGSTHFTIIHNKNTGEYELRKKSHHLF